MYFFGKAQKKENVAQNVFEKAQKKQQHDSEGSGQTLQEEVDDDSSISSRDVDIAEAYEAPNTGLIQEVREEDAQKLKRHKGQMSQETKELLQQQQNSQLPEPEAPPASVTQLGGAPAKVEVAGELERLSLSMTSPSAALMLSRRTQSPFRIAVTKLLSINSKRGASLLLFCAAKLWSKDWHAILRRVET